MAERDIALPLLIDDITIQEGRREVDAATVKRLADSIEKVGLRHPITVRQKGERYILVAGRHRMEACRKLGREHVMATIVSMTNDEARLWEIAENLHRADLTKLERDTEAAEWVKITERLQSRQVGGNESKRDDGRGHRPQGGILAASRELGISEQDAYRAVKVASLSDEAKEAARETGLDNNRSALLKAAAQPTAEAQVATIHRIQEAKNKDRSAILAAEPLNDFETKEKWMASGMAWWNRGSKEWREEFLSRIDTGAAVMDRRFGA